MAVYKSMFSSINKMLSIYKFIFLFIRGNSIIIERATGLRENHFKPIKEVDV